MATRTESIASLYATTSGKRASDITKSDLDHWVNLGSNISLEAINASMLAMSGAVVYPTSAKALVNSTFHAVFGYAPDTTSAGFAYWVNEISTGSVARDTLAIALLNGAADADTAKAIAIVADAVSNFSAGQTYSLTTGVDNIMGTVQNDTIKGHIFNNADSAQSGDMINGGAGTDKLMVDMGSSSAFAVTLDTTSVEEFAVRAESDNTSDQSQNNIDASTVAVNIDAERMVGTNKYESNNSRADLVIEDVRIESTQITKDITIAMVQTDPGNVDMGVYFDQHSLLNAPAVVAGAGLDLKVMDIFNAKDTGDYLLKNPYNKVIFNLGDTQYVVKIDDAYIRGTYAQLLTGVTLAINATAGLESVTAAITGTFTGSDSRDNSTVTGGQTITLTTNDARAFTLGGWATDALVPANSSVLALQALHEGSASTFLVTSTILLDDVGRGSQGGDLIVGGLSTGDTSSSKGVQQFDITVERSSQLQEIQSTNNTLQEVYIKNGVTKGNLTVVGQVAGTTGATSNLPGSDANTAGFTDVRVVDASAMTGSVNINAELTSNVTAKYMNLKDTATNQAADNVTFNYALGSNNDTLNLTMSSANLAAAGTTAREDFKLTVSGNAGNDKITTLIETAATGTNWYANSKMNANMTIDGGAGNDTITTSGAGDMIILAGTGDDTVYSDNTGTKATWAINSVAAGTTDLLSIAPVKGLLYKAQLTVTYSGPDGNSVTNGAASNLINGFEKTVTLGTTDYVASQAQANQAIKDAINNDSVLNKLLVVNDGPSNTIVVTSLVDGVHAANDIQISVAATTLTGLNATELTGIQTAYELLNSSSTIGTLTQANLDAYAAVLATSSVAKVDALGTNSANEGSDNHINLGSGNDVAVLSTDALSNEIIVVTGFDQGTDTIVNFEYTTANAGHDSLDFTSYLANKVTASGSANSQVTATSTQHYADLAGAATISADANDVVILNNFTSTVTTETFSALNAASLLSAVQNNTKSYGTISDADLNVDNTQDSGSALVGTSMNQVVMVENGANDGQYKVFQLTSSSTTLDFTAASYIGTLDFGHTLDGTGSIFAAAAGAVVPPVVVIPGATNVAVTAAGTYTALDTATEVFTATPGTTYTYTIDQFDTTADKISFGTGITSAAISINNTAADGIATFTYTPDLGVTTVSLVLTGLTTAEDTALTGTAGLDAILA